MNIACIHNNGIKYLKLMKSTKSKIKDGIYRQKNIIIKYLGYLKNFDDGKPDYLKRLRQSFKEGHPLIAELIPFVEVEDSQPLTYNISFTEKKTIFLENQEFILIFY